MFLFFDFQDSPANWQLQLIQKAAAATTAATVAGAATIAAAAAATAVQGNVVQYSAAYNFPDHLISDEIYL